MSLLIMACGGGMLAWGLEWHPHVPTMAIAPASIAIPVNTQENTVPRQVADTGILLRRPPFTQERRPPMAVAQSSAPVHAEPPEVVPVPILLGVALSGEQGVAIVAASAGSQNQVVTVNDQVGGWRVVAIGRDNVKFRSVSSEVVVHLKMPDGESPHNSLPRASPSRRERTAAIAITANPSPAECWALSHPSALQPVTEMNAATYGTAVAMRGACNLQRVARR